MTLAMPAGYAASSPPSGLKMPGGLQMPAIPKVGGSAPAASPGVASGLTTTPADNNPAATAADNAKALSSGQFSIGTTPTAFQTQAIPDVTLHPNIITPSGATVNPSTGGLVSPPGGLQMPVTPSLPTNSATGGATFYKPGPSDPGYDPQNPHAIFDSTGKMLNYTDFINAGGKSDFSNVTPGSAPTGQGAPAGAVPPPPATPNIDITDPNSAYYTSPELKAAQTGYAAAQNMTPEEIANTQQTNDLTAKFEAGYTGEESADVNAGTPMTVITGRQKILQDQKAAALVPLQAQAALLQAKRTFALNASKQALDTAQEKQKAFQEANKPVSTPIGTSLTYPGTGKQVGGLAGSSTGNVGDATNGASDGQILGYLEAAGINTTRYNMPGLISAVRAGASAQDIISGKANVAGQIAGASATASNKSQFMIDGNGNLIQVTPKVAGAGASPASAIPNPVGGGAFSAKTAPAAAPAGTTFTLSADGKTVLANGKAIDEQTFKQMTGQTNVADDKVDFSAVQGNKKPASSGAAPKTTAPAAGSTSSSGLSGSAQQYFLSGDISKTGLGSAASRDTLNTQVQNYAKSLGINNWSAAKVAALNAGDAANYSTQIQYLTTTQRSVSNAENGFKQVLSAFPDLNKVGSPLWNKTANELASTLTGGQRNAFEAGLAEIANEYSQVFSRGGANTVSSHANASDIVNGNLSMKDLQSVLTELQAQGKIVVDGARSTVNGILSGFGTGSTPNYNGHTTGQTVTGGDGKQYTVGADGHYYPVQ